MTLLVEELQTEIRQDFKPEKNTNLTNVRLHLYKAGNPSGSLFVEIHSSNGLIATSAPVSIALITGSYYHGKIRFDVTAQLQKDQTYTMVLKSTGYTYGSNYVGWCKAFENRIYPTSFTVAHSMLSPFDYEIWSKS